MQRAPSDYRAFRASELFCPRCRRAMPVRERLLLVLPDGDLFEYCCQGCGSSLGKRKVETSAPGNLIVAR